MGVVINGSVVDPGLTVEGKPIPVKDFLADPKLAILTPEDGRMRSASATWPVRHVILHTTKGIPGGTNKTPQKVLPGWGPNTGVGWRSAAYCRNNPDAGRSRNGGHHLTIDHDGEISCHMDLARVAAYHAHTANEFSIGIEIMQRSDAGLFENQLKTAVALCHWLCDRFGIQKQIHLPYHGPITRLERQGKDCAGVFGHRDVTWRRGQGDPGDFVMQMLEEAGFEPFDFDREVDIAVWKERQKELGMAPANCDGVPGPMTHTALVAAGYENGIWANGKGC